GLPGRCRTTSRRSQAAVTACSIWQRAERFWIICLGGLVIALMRCGNGAGLGPQSNAACEESMFELNVAAAFSACRPTGGNEAGPRYRGRDETGEFVVDRFDGADCMFARISGPEVSVFLPGQYRIESVASGGWLLVPTEDAAALYWIPGMAIGRRLDENGHVTAEGIAALQGFNSDAAGLRIVVSHALGELDIVVWRLVAPTLVTELQTLTALERQALYQWGSHTTFE